MAQPYSTDKLAHHPEALERVARREHQAPISVHFMPMLACNQRCEFCSYGHRAPTDGDDQRGWKNMQLMSDEAMSWEKARECVEDWRAMGVKAVELTGGGEPLIWPAVDDFFQAMARWGADLALVTNGTALTDQRAALFASTNWKWARVSIDAGNPLDYVATRRVPARHWDLAWAAVRRLVAARNPARDQRVGVGFVVDRANWRGVYDFVRLAKESGADNVRIGMAFTPAGIARIPAEARLSVSAQIEDARRLEDDSFTVNALFDERCGNLLARSQDYEYCGVKEVLCVVGGDSNVYSCCSLAFNEDGLVGSIKGRSFRDIWWSPEVVEWFARHDARDVCRVECLYEARNKRILRLIADPAEAARVRSLPVVHANYI